MKSVCDESFCDDMMKMVWIYQKSLEDRQQTGMCGGCWAIESVDDK